MVVILKELVLLKEFGLKESMLLGEPLFLPTQDCDISVICCCLEGCGFDAEDSGFGGVCDCGGSSDKVSQAEEKRGHHYHAFYYYY